MEPSYIAFSYHFATDYAYVHMLANALIAQGVPAWYLDKLEKPTDISMEQRLGGLFDWRREPQNWHATFLDHLCHASGIIVVLSDHAAESRQSVGRGMWRERAAIEYFLADNRLRVVEITRDADSPSPALVSDLIAWGREVLALPPVLRAKIENPNIFNLPTGCSGPLQMPELKTSSTAWCELVRRDLYDVQWHCRRCGLQSDEYAMAEATPPANCPRCGFEDAAFAHYQPEDTTGLSERDRRFFDQLESSYSHLVAHLKRGLERNRPLE